MKRRQLIRFLADHAEAMNRIGNSGELDTAAWLAAYGPDENRAAALLFLLQLAQAVKRALVPVEPSPLFQSGLKAQLSLEEEVMVGRRLSPRYVWLGTAVAGVVGLLILIARLLFNRSRAAATTV